MSYEWGTASLAAPTFDGQLQIDDLNTLWQWNASSSAWVRRSNLSIQESRSATLYPSGMSILRDPFDFRQARFGAEWDTAHSKAFVQVESNYGVVYGRIAQVTKAELLVWLLTVVPNTGGFYTENFMIRVFEVVDSLLQPNRVSGWNNLYGSMRGRGAYRSTRGRDELGMSRVSGINSNFYGWMPGASLSQRLLAHFMGIVAPTPEDRAVWFPRKNRDLYRMPMNVGAPIGSVTFSSSCRRYCWDTSTSTWQPVTTALWHTANGSSLPNPALVWANAKIPPTNVVNIDVMQKARGAAFVDQGICGVVAYHVQQGNLHAFLVKPLGHTFAAADVNLEGVNWELISMIRFRGDASNCVFHNVPFEDRNFGPTHGGWRWSIWNAIPDWRKIGTNVTVDADAIPETISYYARHKLTGLRSPLFPGCTTIVRRQNNAALSFQERRG